MDLGSGFRHLEVLDLLGVDLFGFQHLGRVVRCAEIDVVRRVSLVDRLGHEEEDQDDEYAVEYRGDPIGPVPAKILWKRQYKLIVNSTSDEPE